MQKHSELDDSERMLAEALSGLRPAPLSVDEQDLWFRAGLRSGRRRANGWGIASAAAILLAAGAAFVWQPVSSTIYVDRPVTNPTHPPILAERTVAPDSTTASIALPSASYIWLREAVERNGWDALPMPGGAGDLTQPALRAVTPPADRDTPADRPNPWQI